jgi:FkbM family methyltransferase
MLGSLRSQAARAAFYALVRVGRPFGGVRPRRIYHRLARWGFTRPDFGWWRDRWGDELWLSPHYVVDRYIIAFGCLDENLERYLHRRLAPGEVCLDVGANIGSVAVHMGRRVGPRGKVYAFEPVPGLHERLRGNVRRNRVEDVVECVPLALSNTSGAAEIFAAATTAENQGMGSLVSAPPGQAERRVTVRLQTLDEFVAEKGITRIDVVKVDIQGAEPRFLAGGAQTLKSLRPEILIEFSPEDLRHDGSDSRALAEQLEALGYELYALRGGMAGARLRGATLARDYATSNVLCTRAR